MSEIVLDQVTKRYANGAAAVDGASFTIRDGEFFILVGPSGCGKSTLLNMLVGLEPVTEGKIRLDGKVINDLDPKDRNMAMVFQSYALYPHMSVRENMAFPLKLAKLSPREIEQRVKRTASILGLEELLDRRPRGLSGGQRQRVAMGRALVREPKAFLLDEPLSNLDAQLRQQTRAEIAGLQKRLGVTTVYVTHDQTEAMTLGDRIAVLRDGRIQQVGTPRELYETPSNTFVARFIGSPPMNLLPARLTDGALQLPLGEIPRGELGPALPADDRPLIAGVRPEHLSLVSPGETAARGQLQFEAEIQVVEWLGAELYLVVLPSGQATHQATELAARDAAPRWEGSDQLSIRVDPRLEVERGQRRAFALRTGAIQLFEADSGLRIAD